MLFKLFQALLELREDINFTFVLRYRNYSYFNEKEQTSINPKVKTKEAGESLNYFWCICIWIKLRCLIEPDSIFLTMKPKFFSCPWDISFFDDFIFLQVQNFLICFKFVSDCQVNHAAQDNGWGSHKRQSLHLFDHLIVTTRGIFFLKT